MKMRRVLALVMTVLMVIGMMPAVAAADESYTPVTSVTADNGAVHVVKSVNEAGTELTLEAYLTDKVTQTVSSKPLDIVLVLDQSGSMVYDFDGKRTNKDTERRQYAMKQAVNTFIEAVAAQNGDHKIAIVTFGDSANTLVNWTDVNNEATKLTSAINGLTNRPSGATNVGAGMQKAQELMNRAQSGSNCQKVVVVFTDGVPTTSTDFNTDVANTAISAAKNMKDSGVAIYTVGIFNGANPDELYGASGFGKNSDGTVGSNWSNFSVWMIGDIQDYDIPAGNRFLNYLSSNSVEATGIGIEKYKETFFGIGYRGWKIVENFNCTATNYYLTATDSDSLTNMFQQIVEEISTLDIKADEKTILSDTLSEYFTLNVPEGVEAKDEITVEKWNCTGKENGVYTWAKAATQPEMQVNVTDKKIEVTGFNYTENAVTETTTDNDTTYSGSKLVVKIPIVKDDTCTSWTTGKHPYPTNSVAEGSMAGLSNYKDKENNPLSTLLDKSPTVMIEVSEQEPEIPDLRLEQFVTVKCVNADSVDHEDRIYNVAENEYTSTGEVTFNEDTGNYEYVIYITPSIFIGKYNGEFGPHTIKDIDNINNEVTFVYNKEKSDWTCNSDPVTFYVVCENEPITQKIITVNFDPNGKAFADGETETKTFKVTSPATADISDKLTVPTIEESSEYEFLGWYIAENESYTFTFSGELKFEQLESLTLFYGDEITFIAKYDEIIPDPTPEEEGIIVEIRFNKNEGTWADDNAKILTYAPDNTSTKPVPTVKEDTFTGWYNGDNKVTLGASLTYEEAIAIGKAYGTKSEIDKYIFYTVLLNAQYEKVNPDPVDPPFIIIFPTLEISNKVIAPKNFEKTSFEYDIINVKTGEVEKSVTLKPDSSVKVTVTGGTEYQVVPKDLDVPGYTVTTTADPENGVITSDKIGNVTVDFTHIYTVGLNTEDHFAYIRGYEDGTVRPEGNITRAEVATIFYRLLSSEALEAFKTTENTFTDVDSDAWYNLAVSTLAKAGVISGYPDGFFNPNGQITRAELVSLASKFFTMIEVGDSKFEDIAGHWAAREINEAYINGIIAGYDDGTFKPDQAVTRAEAMKIVNGILGRTTDTCELIDGVKLWPDVETDAWYYYIVAEATNAHKYEATAPEKWTEIIIDEIEY